MDIESAGDFDGIETSRYKLGHRDGITIQVLSLGAVIESLTLPAKSGRRTSVALGYSSLDRYANNSTYFGAVAGRYANRIANAQFSLDGETHSLSRNDGANTLHGGADGFNRRVWSLDVDSTSSERIRLNLTSPDGDQGFPGQLQAAVTYTLKDANTLAIEYEAQTDKPTVVNLTQHTYFNLAGENAGSVLDHELRVNASRFTPVDEHSIPTGVLQPVADTPFDFRVPKRISRDIRVDDPQLLITRGYDHNYVLDRGGASEFDLVLAAEVRDPISDRKLRILTTEPGVQVYSGNFLDGIDVGPTGTIYRQGDGLALETQHFPDSPNQPSFPSVILRPDEHYRSETIWEFNW